jgi:hypothetical protein
MKGSLAIIAFTGTCTVPCKAGKQSVFPSKRTAAWSETSKGAISAKTGIKGGVRVRASQGLKRAPDGQRMGLGTRPRWPKCQALNCPPGELTMDKCRGWTEKADGGRTLEH